MTLDEFDMHDILIKYLNGDYSISEVRLEFLKRVQQNDVVKQLEKELKIEKNMVLTLKKKLKELENAKNNTR